jgi:hypothetical protein
MMLLDFFFARARVRARCNGTDGTWSKRLGDGRRLQMRARSPTFSAASSSAPSFVFMQMRGMLIGRSCRVEWRDALAKREEKSQ